MKQMIYSFNSWTSKMLTAEYWDRVCREVGRFSKRKMLEGQLHIIPVRRKKEMASKTVVDV